MREAEGRLVEDRKQDVIGESTMRGAAGIDFTLEVARQRCKSEISQLR